jgi:protein-S-isoprenylcysteine O-methyltransferase Ste14
VRGPEGGAGRPRPLPRRTRDHRPWRKVFGALLAIAGAVSVMTGHWATTDDMIADLIAGGLVLAVGIVVLLMWSFQR